ncbi:hypothetical protein [Staphylococcus pettenkoferi]|uniref:hypothetical protein n=1 Tax=Staphylococcus pettenkoferi TaxID=170573 RepID=UPI002273DBC6|nr:hypothetical protein [Staphylococcus pettenkoferi]MCY1598003.1 guided entry of tail-anchored proteins factor 1 [Staphylococcus pettenkoferi]
MVKTVKENSISIFDKQIFGKRLRAKEVQQQYNQLVDRIKKINAKITNYQQQDEFAEATKLKRHQDNLEQELLEIDEQLKTSDYSVADDEFTTFYEAYKDEMTDIKKAHEQYRKEMKAQLQEVASTYRKMIENKNEGGRRISRLRYVKQEQQHPSNIHNQYKGQMLADEVKIGGNTTPRDYSWLLEDMLKEESLEDFQKYHLGKKKW